MASADIATASLKIIASNAGLDAGLAQAQQKIAKFSQSSNQAMAQKGGGGQIGGLSGLGGDAAVGAFTGGTSLAISAAASLGAAFVSAFSEIYNSITPSFGQIRAFATAAKDTTRQARSLGLSFEQLQGLQIGARGVDAQTLNQGLMKLNRTAGEAVVHTGAARDSFRQLGISTEQLASNSPDQTFLAVADALSRIQDPAQQARLAVAVLGRSGGQFLNSFRNGAEGIRAAQEEARRLGLSMTNLEASNLSGMSSAFSRLDRILPSIQQHIAAAVAPAFTALANAGLRVWEAVRPFAEMAWNTLGVVFEVIAAAVGELVDWFVELVGNTDEWTMSFDAVRSAVLPVLRVIGLALGQVFDVIKTVGGTMLTAFARPMISAFQSVLEVIETVLFAAAEIPGIGDHFNTAGQGVQRFRRNLGGVADQLERAGENAVGSASSANNINQFFDNLENRAAQAPRRMRDQLDAVRAALLSEITKMSDSLDEAFATFGQNQEEAAITRLRIEHGGAEEDFTRVRQLADRNIGQKLTAESNPTINLQNEMNRLNRLVQNGSITWDVYASQVDKAMKGAEQALGITSELKLSSAVHSGSREAVEAITKFQLEGAQRESPQERLARIQQEALQVQRENRDIGRQMLDVLAGQQQIAVL